MLTYVVALVVCLAPGVMLGFIVPPGRDRWVILAAAPILTLGLTSLGMAWLPKVGLPNSAEWVLGAEIVMAGAAAAGSWFITRRRLVTDLAARDLAREPDAATVLVRSMPGGSGSPGVAAPTNELAATSTEHASAEDRSQGRVTWRSWLWDGSVRPRLIDLLAVTVPAVVTIGFGRMLTGPLAEPPGWDAMNHGILTRNLLEAGSTAITSACTTGSTAPQVSCHFYPLAADVEWAQTAVVSGGHISTAMTAWSTVIGPLALVLAVFAAVRAFGGRPVVAGCAALAAAFLGPMWPALLTGRPPEAFGPGLSVAVALLAASALRSRYPVRLGILAGLGAAGLLMTHTYEILFAAVLTLAFLFATLTRLRLRTALLGAGSLLFATLATIAPLGSALLGAGSERTALKPVFVGQFGRAWHYWITDFQRYVLLGYPAPVDVHVPLNAVPVQAGLALTLPCMLASPLCFVFKQLRWARPWLVTWAVWMAIAIWTTTSDSAASLLVSGLWYGIRERMRTLILPLNGVLAVAGAGAIGLSVHWIVTKLARRSVNLRVALRSTAVAASVLAVALFGLAAAPSAHTLLATDFAQRAPRGGSYPRVFAWLAQHTPEGKVVAYDRNLEYLTWSYANYGVGALFGIALVTKQNARNQDERDDAWQWLVNNAGAKPAGCLIRKFGVVYVAVGHQRVPAHRPASYSRARLAASPNVTLVYEDRGLRVYQVTAAGMACAGGPTEP